MARSGNESECEKSHRNLNMSDEEGSASDNELSLSSSEGNDEMDGCKNFHVAKTWRCHSLSQEPYLQDNFFEMAPLDYHSLFMDQRIFLR